MKSHDKSPRAVGSYVVIKLNCLPEKSPGGIIAYVDDATKQRHEGGLQTGIVHDIGSDVRREGFPEIGDKVFFKRYSGPEIRVAEIPEHFFIVMGEGDIHAILPE